MSLRLSEISWAGFARSPPQWATTLSGGTSAQRKGLRFERKVIASLWKTYPHSLIAQPWLLYELHKEPWEHWCQPDALLLNLHDGTLTVVEIKLSHTVQAWRQLFILYLPVLQKIFEGFRLDFRCCELCEWYDGTLQMPERPRVVPSLLRVKSDQFNVKIF